MDTILIIEDEPAIADNVVYALETEGFQVQWARLGGQGLEILRSRPISLVILDVGLPDCNGFELCKTIRTFSEVPVIFLTARNDEVDRVVGLEIGGDDYVVKPFSPRELGARVKAILKRTATVSVSDSAYDFELDRVRSSVRYRDRSLTLTKSELQILVLLLEQPERVFSRRQILEHIWEQPEMSQERSVDTHIKTLRAKLREVTPDRDPIQTHRGLGYSLSGRIREV